MYITLSLNLVWILAGFLSVRPDILGTNPDATGSSTSSDLVMTHKQCSLIVVEMWIAGLRARKTTRKLTIKG